MSADVAHGTAAGVITLPDSSTVAVTFAATTNTGGQGTLYGAQVNGTGTNYWIPNTPYISTQVENPPVGTDILQLSGGTNETYTVTLSEAIKDPIMAIVSLGQPTLATTYNFDSPFTIVSQGTGYWGGTATSLAVLPNNILQGKEGHGTIQFIGTFSTFSWTVPTPESWHGFTFGIRTTERIEPGVGGAAGTAGAAGSAGTSGTAGTSGAAGMGGDAAGMGGGAAGMGGGAAGMDDGAAGVGGSTAGVGGAAGLGGTAGMSTGESGGVAGPGGAAGVSAVDGAGGMAGATAAGGVSALGGAAGSSAGLGGFGGAKTGSGGMIASGGTAAAGHGGGPGAGGKGGAAGKPGSSSGGCDCNVDVSGRELGLGGLLTLFALVIGGSRRSRRRR